MGRLRQTGLVERNSGAPVRRHQARTQDRKRELVEIACRLIADNGLEGLHESPEQFIVLSELAIRSWRDSSIAEMFKRLDDGWYAHLEALLKRGIEQGLFRKDLDVGPCARAIMVALRGIGYQSRLPRRKLDALLSELAAQTEHWIRAELVRPRK
jgi:hypothetical protein